MNDVKSTWGMVAVEREPEQMLEADDRFRRSWEGSSEGEEKN